MIKINGESGELVLEGDNTNLVAEFGTIMKVFLDKHISSKSELTDLMNYVYSTVRDTEKTDLEPFSWLLSPLLYHEDV